MEFIDLALQQLRIKEKIDSKISEVLSHGQYINGPEVRRLEETLAAYVGSKYAIGCASGTDALLLGLMAYGVGPGDVIFTTPFTFIATAEIIRLLGAVPVFVDVDPRTFNIDTSQLEIAIQALKAGDFKSYPLPARELILSAAPRGIIGVDLFGLPADYEKINKMAENSNLFVIEDAAQSFGAEYFGKKACSLAEIGCTSFFPAKPLGCYGDGGMCFTDNSKLAEIIESLKAHGKGKDKYDNVRVGINGRLDTLQAAIILAKFEVFPEEIENRQTVANRYSELIDNDCRILRPLIPEGKKSAWAQYCILFESENKRKSCQVRLANEGIPSAIHYPKPLHLQTAFAGLGYKKGDFPVSEDLSRRILSLPMHPYLSEEDQVKVIRVISEGT
jgi:UDP-2-acetamido-2-deoxy-ribo-hexuluronate aminotransferase